MTSFVPDIATDLSNIDDLAELLDGGQTAVLTGAGCSTASGIPDYRGPETKDQDHNAILYDEFVGEESARRRYWARSAIGWLRIRRATPNDAHLALVELERRGLLSGLITQNVDDLHGRAGSRRIVSLHGTLSEVLCLDCGGVFGRAEIQRQIERKNPGWTHQTGGEIAPDGDVELPTEIPEEFGTPVCEDCGGMLKPNVVFFGENVADDVVENAWRIVRNADVLLVAGSSLTVYSGYRFVRGADRDEKPVAIVNLGDTRGDEHAAVRVEARVGAVLSRLCERL